MGREYINYAKVGRRTRKSKRVRATGEGTKKRVLPGRACDDSSHAGVGILLEDEGIRSRGEKRCT